VTTIATYTWDDAQVRKYVAATFLERLVSNFNKRKLRKEKAPLTADDMVFCLEGEVIYNPRGTWNMRKDEVERAIQEIDDAPDVSLLFTWESARLTHEVVGGITPSSIFVTPDDDGMASLWEEHKEVGLAAVVKYRGELLKRLGDVEEEEKKSRDRERRAVTGHLGQLRHLGKGGAAQLASVAEVLLDESRGDTEAREAALEALRAVVREVQSFEALRREVRAEVLAEMGGVPSPFSLWCVGR